MRPDGLLPAQLLSLLAGRAWSTRFAQAARRPAGPQTEILVGTTLGPARIQSISVEPGAALSVMCVNGQTRETRVSRAYHSFVAHGTGIVEKCYGAGPYRMDVSDEIDTGASWQLGAAAAHALRAAGRLAEGIDQRSRDPAWVVWTTGTVRAADGTVEPVELVADKLQAALSRLEGEARNGRRVTVVVPAGNVADVPVALRAELAGLGIEWQAVATVHDLERALEIPRSRVLWREQAVLRASIAGASAIAVLAACVWAASAWQTYNPLGFMAGAVRPSFQCSDYLRANPYKTSKGRSPEGDLMCHDEELGANDRAMGEAYRQFLATLPTEEERASYRKTEHGAWRRERDRQCGLTWERLEGQSYLAGRQCLIVETIERRQFYQAKLKAANAGR
jgi:uncharacterized protein YecT (DUF1311 family)